MSKLKKKRKINQVIIMTRWNPNLNSGRNQSTDQWEPFLLNCMYCPIKDNYFVNQTLKLTARYEQKQGKNTPSPMIMITAEQPVCWCCPVAIRSLSLLKKNSCLTLFWHVIQGNTLPLLGSQCVRNEAALFLRHQMDIRRSPQRKWKVTNCIYLHTVTVIE